MIHLITGLPGSGKTLYTLWHVKARAEKEQRPVFYSGIEDLQIPAWQEMEDPEKWHELPTGAIIVIDEAQRIFRPRGKGGEPPKHVAALETHRHNGHDLYIITQHPMLVDTSLRRLAGVHRHLNRQFGTQRAVIHEWAEVRLDCERRRTDSSKTIWPYPKDVYSLYKSSELHTHRINFPKYVWYLLISLLLLAVLGFFIVSRTSAKMSHPEPEEGALSPIGATVPSFGGEKTPLTADEYVKTLIPEGRPGIARNSQKIYLIDCF
jgi:zona occludens toxin (predicted ATPase)